MFEYPCLLRKSQSASPNFCGLVTFTEELGRWSPAGGFPLLPG